MGEICFRGLPKMQLRWGRGEWDEGQHRVMSQLRRADFPQQAGMEGQAGKRSERAQCRE